MHFGQTLRVLRTTARLSLRELARQIAVSAAYLSQVETGKAPPPSPKRIRAIEVSLGVPEGYLLSAAERLDLNVAALLHDVPPVADFLRTALEVGLEGDDFQDMITLLKAKGAAGMRRAMRQQGHLDLDADGAAEIRHVSDYLVEERITILKGAQDKDTLFGELASRVSEYVPGLLRDTVLDELWEREREASTGIGSGIAVPHATHPVFERTVLILLVLEKAVDYDAVDGEPVDICFLLLAPDSARREHLELLARVAQLCSHPSFVKGVRSANTPAEILDFVKLCPARIP